MVHEKRKLKSQKLKRKRMSGVPKENLTPEEKKQKKEQSKEKDEIDKQVQWGSE